MSWNENAIRLCEVKRIDTYAVMAIVKTLPMGFTCFEYAGVMFTAHKSDTVCPVIGLAK